MGEPGREDLGDTNERWASPWTSPCAFALLGEMVSVGSPVMVLMWESNLPVGEGRWVGWNMRR